MKGVILMFEKILAFFMSIVTFFMQLLGLSTNVTTVKNVAYGDSERQVVDIYLPKNAEETTGLMVFIHGGAWVSGDKSTYEKNCKSVADEYGYVTAAVNYRYINDSVHCEDMLEDIDAAVTKIKEVAAENGITIKAAAYGGHSAGGHLALMYSYTYADKSAVPVAFCFDMSGPADMKDVNFFADTNALGHDNVLNLCTWLTGLSVTDDNLYNEEIVAALDSVSPVSYVTSETVPTIIAHGNADDIVPYSNAVTLDSALTAAGVEHTFITYKNTGHGLDNDSAAASLYEETLKDYANRYLK